jgi:hypothetical protein
MRQTIILAALAAVILSLWGATTIVANQKATNVEQATTSIGVVQMMKEAKNLPEQQFDAH